jgi:UPF0716 protein FxsA
MNGFFLQFGRWPVTGLKGVVLAWLVAEVLAFCLAIKLLGVGGTVVLGLVTTLLGVATLRRLGLDAARHLRRSMTADRNDAFVDGTLAALGAVLLIVPGFVSDAMGLALASPSIRQRLATRLVARTVAPGARPSGRPTHPEVIDLSPEDWRVVDKTGRA